jgi:hypothetical protein
MPKWAVRRINRETCPFALIDTDGRFGDEFVASGISEQFAPTLARVTGAAFQG